MRILGISGSLRRDSHNTTLLRAAAELLPSGTELVLYEGLADLPPFNEDEETPLPAAVAALRAAMDGADGILFATPEYNSSIPGVLKNAVDWASRKDPATGETALRNVPVAVVGASTGMFGAVWAQAELRRVLSATGARVVDRELPVVHAHEAFGADGMPVDADLRAQLAAHVAELAAAIDERALARAA